MTDGTAKSPLREESAFEHYARAFPFPFLGASQEGVKWVSPKG